MDRQALLNHAVITLDGKGQAKDGPQCTYFPPDPTHPGCAIGCQKGFRANFRWKIEETDIATILTGNFGARVCKFFGVRVEGPDLNADDVDYLEELQALHDMDDNWEGDNWKVTAVEEFCNRFGLEVPKLRLSQIIP